MTANYMRQVCLFSKRCTPATAGEEGHFSLPNGGVISGITVTPVVAGTQTKSAIKVTTWAGATVVTLTVGTTAAGVPLTARTAEASALRAASSTNTGSYKVVSVTNDSTASYYVYVWGTLPLD